MGWEGWVPSVFKNFKTQMQWTKIGSVWELLTVEQVSLHPILRVLRQTCQQTILMTTAGLLEQVSKQKVERCGAVAQVTRTNFQIQLWRNEPPPRSATNRAASPLLVWDYHSPSLFSTTIDMLSASDRSAPPFHSLVDSSDKVDMVAALSNVDALEIETSFSASVASSSGKS